MRSTVEILIMHIVENPTRNAYIAILHRVEPIPNLSIKAYSHNSYVVVTHKKNLSPTVCIMRITTEHFQVPSTCMHGHK